MLLFTVMDYDVLTANDFAGEALLSLNTVPGVATAPQGLDTFHGLKHIDLVLMHQPNKRKRSTLLPRPLFQLAAVLCGHCHYQPVGDVITSTDPAWLPLLVIGLTCQSCCG